jgi:excisionase family DNA binding protein
MSSYEKDWLSLTEASKLLGIHPTTLRRWADLGSMPCFRTPGGHRRFRTADLTAWVRGRQPVVQSSQAEALVQSAVGFTRQEMADKRVSNEPWYAAFTQEDERQHMRDTGRRLFGLAVQYTSRTRGHAPILQEGRRIARFYGQQCAQHGVSLVQTVRALSFFRESLTQAINPSQASPWCWDAEDIRIHYQLGDFLDEVLYACLDGYQATYLAPTSRTLGPT